MSGAIKASANPGPAIGYPGPCPKFQFVTFYLTGDIHVRAE